MRLAPSPMHSPSFPLGRRDFLKSAVLVAAGSGCLNFSGTAEASILPDEPLVIGQQPQFLFDMFVVDNHWPLHRNDVPIRLNFHQRYVQHRRLR